MNTFNSNPRSGYAKPAASRSGAALLITLLILALMTIIVVAFLGTMSSEVQVSRRNFESQKARGLATLGLDTAVSQLREARGQWDIPYGNEQGNFGSGVVSGFVPTSAGTITPTNFWSVSPGILTAWSYTNVAPITNYPLFSLPAGGMTATTAIVNSTGITATANLNAQAEDGTYPILGTPTPLEVDWVNVLANPASTTASAANPIIGRFAFWMDDENSKININTADGVLNTNLPSMTGPGTYMGAGTPTEVSLEELQTGGNTLPTTAASNIVYFARTSGFNSPREILRYTGGNLDIYTNNVFNLTTFSRSPDLNIFGQPKIPLIPSNMSGQPYTNAAEPNSEFVWNLATLQPLKELFPSVAGTSGTVWTGVLPALKFGDPYAVINSASTTNAFTSNYYANVKWPTAFMDQLPTGVALNPTDSGDNSPWVNGKVIANYLAGTNTTLNAITWPAFPNAAALTTGGYIGSGGNNGKYTKRQVDSITLQIIDLASKDFSPDLGDTARLSTYSSDSIYWGWLSGKLVNGVARNPKLDKVLMQFQAQYSNTAKYGVGSNAVYTPALSAALYMELWFPSRFSGTSLFHDTWVYGTWVTGTGSQPSMMNCQDCGVETFTNSYLGGSAFNINTTQPGMIPRLTNNAGYVTNNSTGFTNQYVSYPPDGTADSWSYWQNNLLQNDVGVDWAGNNPSAPDSDQYLAAKYHPSYLYTNSPGTNWTGYIPTSATTGTNTVVPLYNKYLGAGQGGANVLGPIFQMNTAIKTTGHDYSVDDWPPGECRWIANTAGMGYFSPMWTNVVTGTNATYRVNITGGVAYLAQMDVNRGSDSSPVPLEAYRGSSWPTNNPVQYGFGNRTGERFYGTYSPYTNMFNAVIPISVTVPIPQFGSITNNSIWVYTYPTDPLVNKFPGDWTPNTTVSVSTPAVASQAALVTTTNSTYLIGSSYQTLPSGKGRTGAIYPETSSTAANLTDPDSYWLPTIDCDAGLSPDVNPSDGPSFESIDPPQIPRTARFPSIGYLQYVRTGIMPDDETVPYVNQHGTPFRLLNFNQASDASQSIHGVSYPDWAMLDLFYLPSSLLSYGSPYEAYAGRVLGVDTASGTNVVVNYTNTNAVNNMYRFGTYGGATSGRINPNGSVVYTTSMNVPNPNITRTVPLQALLHGLSVNQTQVGTYNTNSWTTNDFHAPVLSGGVQITPALETNLADAIVSYLTNNTYGVAGNPAPLRMPAEICNIPAIAAYQATNSSGTVINATRNDLVRQIVGNLTTQSNTFSIWVEAQSITKSKGNSNWGLYEASNPGQADDQITGTVRYHFIVERDFDPGTDGVYGNAGSSGPGPDGIVGTLDDPAASGAAGYNPLSPSYFYKIIYAEEIR